MTYSENVLDKITMAICHRNATDNLGRQVDELKFILKLIGTVMTPNQLCFLSRMSEVKKILEQENVGLAEQGCQGSLGGFGTEELQEWERMRLKSSARFAPKLVGS